MVPVIVKKKMTEKLVCGIMKIWIHTMEAAQKGNVVSVMIHRDKENDKVAYSDDNGELGF